MRVRKVGVCPSRTQPRCGSPQAEPTGAQTPILPDLEASDQNARYGAGFSSMMTTSGSLLFVDARGAVGGMYAWPLAVCWTTTRRG